MASRACSPSTRRPSTRCSCSATSSGRAARGGTHATARWPWLRAAAARCRGLLLAAEGDTDAALRELADALEQHRALDMPFALARTELALGSAQRRAKQRAAARASLAQAEAAFEALGASGGPSAPAAKRRGSPAAGRATTPA